MHVLHLVLIAAVVAVASAASSGAGGVVTRSSYTSVRPAGAFDGHLSLAQTYAFLDDTHAAVPEVVAAPLTIGQSLAGHAIKALCIGACEKEGAPAALYTGLHHAREVFKRARQHIASPRSTS